MGMVYLFVYLPCGPINNNNNECIYFDQQSYQWNGMEHQQSPNNRFGPTLAQLWPDFGPTLAQLWPELRISKLAAAKNPE